MITKEKGPWFPGFGVRINIVGAAMVIACAILCVRLWELQVVRWSEFQHLSDENRLRIQHISSPRGMILGSSRGQEVVIADNRAARDLMFVPAECEEPHAIIVQRLASLIGIEEAPLLDKIESAIDASQPYRQIVVKKDVPRSVLARVEEYAYALPGVFTIVRPQRRYLYGKTAGQILGYLNEIGPEELKANRERYRMGDLIGRRGLERVYEEHLHGRDGQMLVTQYARGRPQIRTDAYGRPYADVDEFGHHLKLERAKVDPIPGRTLRVTLDMALQQKAEELLEGEEGAIVVLNANTGAVLALASAPGYDPSIFVDRGMGRQLRTTRIREILTGKPNRMINRCFQEVYAPGSVYKILMAGAALEEGVITPETTFYCAGKFRISPNSRAFGCWKRSGHGNVSVVDAIAFSCDVFFYNVGLELGVDRIKAWSTKMGLGVKTGIDLPGEAAGLIPSREWKEKQLKPKFPKQPWEYRWYPGETLNMSIGQGYTNSTPLQCALLAASVVNGGFRVHPFMNAELGSKEPDRIWSETTCAVLVQGMRKCVEKGPPAPTGTGKLAAVEGLTILGKTGSAQVMSLSQHAQYATEEDIPKFKKDHAWFITGVLNADPPLAACILVEHGHHGSSVAAPLAKELFEFYYANDDQPEVQLARAGSGGR